jgi:hypothetical protein
VKRVEHHTRASEAHRLAACLVHAVAGAVAMVATSSGERLVVAHHRADATLDPCQLRAALTAPVRPGVPHLADVVTSIEIVGGLVDIGGGLYQRSHPGAHDERWFVTPLAADRVATIVTDCPLRLPDGAVNVRVVADSVLAVSAVCLVAGPGFGYRLDEAAFWLHTTCLVDELIGGSTNTGAPRTA